MNREELRRQRAIVINERNYWEKLLKRGVSSDYVRYARQIAANRVRELDRLLKDQECEGK